MYDVFGSVRMFLTKNGLQDITYSADSYIHDVSQQPDRWGKKTSGVRNVLNS